MTVVTGPKGADLDPSQDQNESTQPLPMLGYATSREFERAVFRCIGWIGMLLSVLLIGRLFADVVSTVAFKRAPQWVLVLFEWRRNSLENILFRYWSTSINPLFDSLISLLLLAGSIGCFRRYSRTRYWMIAYAVLHIVGTLLNAATNSYVIYSIYRDNQFGFGSFVGMEGLRLLAGFLQGSAEVLLRISFDIILLWLMTRPYVGELFKRRE
ncbi:MAG: hypothetical protein H7144_04990 [Burkholderiales bacterium]|nr:hypothetical protein [Phycisphaerae bacterium]